MLEAWSESAGDLDECNGTTIDGTYAYLVTNDYPFVGRCLNGEADAQGGPGGSPSEGEGDASGEAPDLSDAADALGVSVAELQDALGGPPPDFEAAAEILGISVEELTAALPAGPNG